MALRLGLDRLPRLTGPSGDFLADPAAVACPQGRDALIQLKRQRFQERRCDIDWRPAFDGTRVAVHRLFVHLALTIIVQETA